MSQPTTIQTENGYQCGNLAVENLPKCQALVLMFSALGLSEKKIAIVMECSIGNIKQAKQTLFFKLRANNTTEAVTKAFVASYLRLLTFFIAILISAAAPTLNDHNTLARLSRTRPTTQLRLKSGLRLRNSKGIYWSPETNALIFS